MTLTTPTLFCVDLSEAVVAHLIHETVEEDGRALPVDTELALWCEVVRLLDVGTFLCATSNTNHPKKLIDVYKSNNSTKITICDRPREN